MLLPQLKRIRWAVRLTLMLGVAASVAANVLHAQPQLISQVISAWPPLALLLTVELTSRIPMHKPLLASVRVLATVAIAGIAAWVSYWHMQGVAVKFGETETSSYLLPISVDGLIVVASVSLVELAGRIRMLEERKQAAYAASVAPVQFIAPPAAVPAPAPAPAAVFQAAPVSPAPALERTSERPTTYVPASVADELARVAHATPVSRDGVATASPRVPTSPVSGRPLAGFGETPASAPVSPAVASPAYVNGSAPIRQTRAAVSSPARTVVTASTELPGDTAPRPRRPVLETAELADAIEARQPGITLDEIAEEIGISPARLRQVRREAAALR